MVAQSTTRLSTKGQVVIPEAIRRRLKLKAGTQFLVFAEGNDIFFFPIRMPSRKQIDALKRAARRLVNPRMAQTKRSH